MIATLLNTLPKGNAKTLSIWNRGLGVIDTRFDYIMHRFQAAQPSPSKGVRMLESLLSNIPEDYFLTDASDMTMYTRYFDDIVEAHSSIFDSVKMKQSHMDTFIKSSNVFKTSEVITGMGNDTPLTSLPMGQPYGYWMNTTSLKILNLDSVVLPTETEGSQLSFGIGAPTVCEFGLNTKLLMMKYIKYKQFKTSIEEPGDVVDFIHSDVIYNMRLDSFNNWLLNVIYNLIVDEYSSDKILELQNQFVVSSSMFKSTLMELSQMIDMVRYGKITISDFMTSNWLNGQSIIDYANKLNDEFVVLEDHQHTMFKFLRDVSIIRIVLALMNLSTKYRSKYSLFLSKLRRKIERFERSDPYGRTSDPKVIEMVKNNLYELKAVFMKKG